MFEVLKAANPIYHPSKFWEHLNDVNIDQLERRGYADFKRTINQNYFNFLITSPRNEQFRRLFLWWLKHPTLRILTAHFGAENSLERRAGRMTLNGTRALIYKVFVAMLWEYTRAGDREGLLERLEEPSEGNPLDIRYKGKRISQDLCNSVLEYYSASSALSQNTGEPLTIAELGGGYGRTAYVFLKACRCKYVLFDIPPALAVCQRYLQALFPDRKMFTFRPFKTYDEIRAEYEAAEICIMTPNQMELLPTKTFELFLNISSFGEMTAEQIEHYYRLIDRYCRGCFYTKQWQEHVNDQDKITISAKDYPTPNNWELIYSRQHPIQARFFEALYKV